METQLLEVIDTPFFLHDWVDRMNDIGAVMPLYHKKNQTKRKKGDATHYMRCIELCKSRGLNPLHVRKIREYRGIIESCDSTLWELLHDQIYLLLEDEHQAFKNLKSSRVLEKLGQKIGLRHISRILGEYLKPIHPHYVAKYIKDIDLPCIPDTFTELAITFTGKAKQDLPPQLKIALDYFKIHYYSKPTTAQCIKYQELLKLQFSSVHGFLE